MSILRFRVGLSLVLAVFLILPAVVDGPGRQPRDAAITDLAIGNSHARSINFAVMGLNGVNANEPGADVRQTIQTFRDVGDQYPGVERVWIPVAPVYLYMDHTKPQWLRRRHSIGLINAFDEVKFYSDDVATFWGAGKQLLSYVASKSIPRTYPRNEFIVEGGQTTRAVLDPEDFPHLIEDSVTSHVMNASPANTANFARLNAFFSELEDAGIEVVLFIPPYTAEYFNHPLLADYVDHYGADLKSLTSGHANVHWVDFHDLYPREDYGFFLDDDHLNLTGAEDFSPVLRDAVSKRLKF